MKEDGKWNNTLEYCLTDVLELKYTTHEKSLQTVMKKLLSRRFKDSNLYPLSAFLLGDILVVIGDGRTARVQQLYLLDANRKSFQVFGMTPTL